MSNRFSIFFLIFLDFFVFGRKPDHTAGAAEENEETGNRSSKSSLIFYEISNRFSKGFFF